jgi:hypothetical protein
LTCSLNVVLTAYLVCPGPFVQIRRRCHLVEAAIPKDRACLWSATCNMRGRSQRTRGHGAQERIDNSCLSKHVGNWEQKNRCVWIR